MASRPSVAVFGLGSYYRKLKRGLRRFFDVAALFDVRLPSELELDDADTAVFHQLA